MLIYLCGWVNNIPGKALIYLSGKEWLIFHALLHLCVHVAIVGCRCELNLDVYMCTWDEWLILYMDSTIWEVRYISVQRLRSECYIHVWTLLPRDGQYCPICTVQLLMINISITCWQALCVALGHVTMMHIYASILHYIYAFISIASYK